MTITGKASHLSHSPRKVNLVAKAIVGMGAQDALVRLQFQPQRAATAVAKVLKQAIANASNSFAADPKQLKIQSAFATKGRVLKRGHIGGRSKYKPYEKTFAHLTINLVSPSPVAKVAPKVAAAPVIEEAVETKPTETKTKTTKPTKTNTTKKTTKTNLTNKTK